MRKPCYDSPDPRTRKLMYWYCPDTGKCYDKALAGSIVYDPPETAKPCPYNMKSANNGTICFGEFSNTPILDSLEASTDFPAPQRPLTKRKSGPRPKSLTELMGGPF